MKNLNRSFVSSYIMTKTIFGKKLLILTTIAVLVTSLMLFAIPASAAHLSCGDTVTTDTTLDADLICAGTPGLIIGAAGITIDLNGHTISGTACGFCHGIRNGDFSATANPSPTFGFDDVKIKGPGTIIGFEQGIRGDTVSRFTIENVIVRDQTSSSAIDILDSKDVKIKNVSISITTVSGAIEAIRLQNVDNVKVEKVNVVGGAVGVNFGCGSCDGTEQPTNGVIKDSTFINNGNGIFLAQTTDAKVKNNVVSGSSGTAILVGLKCFVGSFPAVTNVEISKNVVSNNDASGITLCTADNSKVNKNIVTGNGGYGIRVLDSDDNKIEKNTAVGNTGKDMKQDAASSGNTWKKNTCITTDDAGSGPIDCP